MLNALPMVMDATSFFPGLAVLATAGAMKQVDAIRTKAVSRRAALNEEMGSVAEVLSKVLVTFAGKAGETGKLYGSITTQMIADQILNKTGIKIERRQIDSQPIRVLGDHKRASALPSI